MKYTRTQIQNIRQHLSYYCKPMTKYGEFKVDRSESLEHNLEMASQFVELSYAGYVIAVRPTLKNGNKPDLMILDTPRAMIKEILKSETDKRFESKDYMGIPKIKRRIKWKKEQKEVEYKTEKELL